MESNTNADLDKLITFGQMALEQGWYDQAREHFEQALALDTSNREAMKGLARVNEILGRKEAAAVEPVRGEPVEPPLRPEAQPSEQKEAPAEQRAEGLLKGSLKIGCGVSLGILMILTLCIGGLIVFGVLLAPEPEQIGEKALTLGGMATMEGVRVSINSYEFASSYEDEYWGQVAPEQGATFLWVHVYAENAEEVERSLPSSYRFRLLYKGDEIQYHTTWYVTGRELYSGGSVYPGVSREGWILYELPDAAQAHDIVVQLEWHHRAWVEPEYSFWRLGP